MEGDETKEDGFQFQFLWCRLDMNATTVGVELGAGGGGGCLGMVPVIRQGGGKNAIRIFSHFPHFFSHFLGRSLSVMFKRIHSSGIV